MILLCNSSKASIWGVALSWKNKPQGSGLSYFVKKFLYIVRKLFSFKIVASDSSNNNFSRGLAIFI
jgi:hypothetical protein